MRVAVVSMETTHHRDTQGTRRLERVAEGLAAAGHDVTVYCAQWWGGEQRQFAPDDITYRAVTVDPNPAAFAARLPVRIARNGADVVHARPAPPTGVVAAKAGAVLARAPLVVDWFGDEVLPDGRQTEWATRVPDRIVTPSEMVRTTVRELGADGDDTTVIPESIDMALVRDIDPAEEVDVAFAHPLDDSANVESLLLGLAELREKDWSVTVIGDGPNRADYERQARDLRIDDRVTFAGACDRSERVAIYRGAHVFVQTAYREYFASELLWALACGCVGVVEYQVNSSAHELIEQRERSFRVTSTQAMADAIVESANYERLTVDDSLAEFDHGAIRQRYLDNYEELIEARGVL